MSDALVEESPDDITASLQKLDASGPGSYPVDYIKGGLCPAVDAIG